MHALSCKAALAAMVAALAAWPCSVQGQELEPRAFSPAPVGTSFVIAGIGHSDGAFVLDPSLPFSDVQADLSFVTLGGGYTFELFGRQARVLAAAPYAWGDISGDVDGVRQTAQLDGFADPRIKVSIGLIGAPALSVSEFAHARRGTALGASLTIMPPLGRYDASSVVNLGYNRWAFKPEIGVSHPIGRWTLEASAGAWLFADNVNYLGMTRAQAPIAALQGHVGYTFENRSWIALDGTWFSGGRTRVDGVDNPDRQENTRFGVTYSTPLSARQSVKFTYSSGATTRRGSDFDTFNITWQRVAF